MVELYITSICPFCIKVVRAADQMGLEEGKDYQLIDAGPGTEGRQKVIASGGKSTVPFLIHGSVSMYESDDIIDYLRIQAGK